MAGPATSDVSQTSDQEIALVRTFVESIQQLNVEGTHARISLPPLDELNFKEFNTLIKQGKKTGRYGVDSRMWAAIKTAFLFLQLEYIRAR